MPKAKRRVTVTMIVRVAFALVAAAMLVRQALETRTLLAALDAKTSVGPIQYNEAIQSSIDLFTDQSTSWSQATLVLLGLLAALWVAKADQARLVLKLEYVPELVMWFASIVLLIGSLYCYTEYVQGVASALEVGGVTSDPHKPPLTIANVFDNKYDALRREQLRLFMFGGVASILALFSANNLAGDRNV